jgi:hypothetical protein
LGVHTASKKTRAQPNHVCHAQQNPNFNLKSVKKSVFKEPKEDLSWLHTGSGTGSGSAYTSATGTKSAD